MPIDYARIYRESAAAYDRLVSAEDRDGNIFGAMRAIRELRGARVLEVGVGTGRITRLLAPAVARLWGFDRAPAMLAVAAARLRAERRRGVALALGDARALPVRAGCADVAVAGWVFGHFTAWHEATWRDEVTRAVGEMERALRPGGVVIILETMGTGRTEPAPPTAALAAYYERLEQAHGFSRFVIRTDYEFPSLADAVGLTRLFFGEALATGVAQRRSRRVPECTGVWWKAVAP